MIKFVTLVVIVGAFFSCVSARFAQEDKLFIDEASKEAMKEMNAKFKAGLEEVKAGFTSGPAVNWVWSSWSAGPTCVDNSNLTLVDIPNETLSYVFEYFDKILEKYSQTFQDKLGIGIGITYNGKTIYTNFSGRINVTSDEKPTEDTILHVGSNTKMVTSMLLHILAEKGALNLTDPVTKYFNENNGPAFDVVNPYDPEMGADAVTLESLAGQSSGLPTTIECYGKPECTEEICIKQACQYPLFHQPLTRPHYSNTGFAVLGRCCERAAREFFNNDTLTYESVAKELILDVLGMYSSGFDFPDDVKARMATGYDYVNGQLVVDSSFGISRNWVTPAGGMRSTMRDMLNWAKHLTGKETLLSPDGFEEYFLPGVDLSDGVSSFGRAGWEVVYANGFRTITKGGLSGGFNSEIVLIPELKIGVFGWVNLASDFASAITAAVTNVLVPFVLDYLKANQPKIDLPSVIDDIVGSYGAQNVSYLVIESNDQTATTGVLVGNVLGQPVWYVYDKKTTEAYQKEETYFFRFFSIPDEYSDSCMALSMEGADNSLVQFTHSSDTWIVLTGDTLYSLEKL